jgi:hypothetical protein
MYDEQGANPWMSLTPIREIGWRWQPEQQIIGRLSIVRRFSVNECGQLPIRWSRRGDSFQVRASVPVAPPVNAPNACQRSSNLAFPSLRPVRPP